MPHLPTENKRHIRQSAAHSPKCCRLGGTASSSCPCRCTGACSASSSRSCCSGPAWPRRSPASWNPSPPGATGSGRYPEGTTHPHLWSKCAVSFLLRRNKVSTYLQKQQVEGRMLGFFWFFSPHGTHTASSQGEGATAGPQCCSFEEGKVESLFLLLLMVSVR